MTTDTAGTNTDYLVMLAYFVFVVGFGLYFGRYAKTTRDFFLGGQRFSWWLIAFSAVATLVGSYSFIKYSEVGFSHGISSTQSYLNDWFWAPVLLLVWLPIIYFQRIQSVPEYFERRFGRAARVTATVFILLYLVGYVGVNLLTIGRALQPVLGWDVFTGALVACVLVTLYVLAGGQTSVIMTDLAQGIILLVAGVGLFLAGVLHVGGFVDFWAWLPESHRQAFSPFNRPDNFSFIGIYVQDGLANSGAFLLMNQGILMRFLALRGMKDAKKMVAVWLLALSPLAAIAVSGGGWIAWVLAARGEIETTAQDAFVSAARFLCSPGVFGLILAALMAALMSTADTLINAVSAIFVNDIYRPYIARDREDRHYLRVARLSSLCTAAIGLALVPIMMGGTIYQAHAMFTAAVTPPILVAILLGVLWRRFNAPAAMATMLGGGFLVALTFFAPFQEWFLWPYSFGMGPASYGFTRAFFGLVMSLAVGIGVAVFTKPQPYAQLLGLVSGTQLDAMRVYKGGEINRRDGKAVYLRATEDASLGDSDRVLVPEDVLADMAADVGDIAYICDKRWWFGGLRSAHVKISGLSPDADAHVSPMIMEQTHFTERAQVYIEKVC